MRNKGFPYAGNNRKRTNGRTLSYAELEEMGKKTKKDKGFFKHEGTKFLVSVCPQTGQRLYAKCGKAIKGDFTVTMEKGSVSKKRFGIRIHEEREEYFKEPKV